MKCSSCPKIEKKRFSFSFEFYEKAPSVFYLKKKEGNKRPTQYLEVTKRI